MNRLNLILLNIVLCAINKNIYTSENLILGASYVIYEGDTDIVRNIPYESKRAFFFTYDGDLIKEEFHNFNEKKMNSMLDPNARKPQPTKITIEYWPDAKISPANEHHGYFIVFYDKNNNKIISFRTDDEKKRIVYAHTNLVYKACLFNKDKIIMELPDFPLDLSIATGPIEVCRRNDESEYDLNDSIWKICTIL